MLVGIVHTGPALVGASSLGWFICLHNNINKYLKGILIMKTNSENIKKNSCGMPALPYNFKAEHKVKLNYKKFKEFMYSINTDKYTETEFEFDCLDSMVKSPLDWSWLDVVGAWRVLAFYSPWSKEEKEEKKEVYFTSILKEYKSTKIYGGRRWVGFNNALKSIGVLFFGGYMTEPSLIYHDGYEVVKIMRIYDSQYALSYMSEASVSRWDLYIVEEDKLLETDSHFNLNQLYNRIERFDYVDVFTEERGYYFNDYWAQCEWCGGLYSSDDEHLQYIDRVGIICDDCLEDRGWVWCRDSRMWVNPSEGVYPCDGCCCGCYYDNCDNYEEPEPENNNSTGDPALDELCGVRDYHGYSSGSPASALVVNYEEVDPDSAAGLSLRASGLFCGVEIETSIEEVKNYGALDRIIKKNSCGVLSIKSDSSLDSGCGSEAFEFVTLKLFNALAPDSAGAVRDLVRDIEDAGFMPDSSCGGHMHFDLKGCISEENWVRFAYLVENTDSTIIRDLFGRSFGGYCSKLGPSIWAEAFVKIERGDSWGEVLARLNNCSHGYFIRRTSRTVEVRLFAGVSCWEDIVERCGVVVKLLKYAEGRSFEELRRGYEEEEEEELW